MISIVMLIIGLTLIYSEFFLPGGIMGSSGALLIISAIVFYSMESEELSSVLAFCLLSIFSTVLTIYIALRTLKLGKKENSLYNAESQEGFHSSSFENQLIGKKGFAKTDLKPSGHVLIDGKSQQALSKSSYIEKGSAVEVIAGQGAYLIVKPHKEDS